MPEQAKPEARRRGRPPVPIDDHELEKLAAMNCTDTEIAGWFEISYAAFTRKKANSAHIREILERGHAKGRATLRRYQMRCAEKGNATMCIWLGKQLLGQRDKVDADLDVSGTISLATVDAILAAAAPRVLPPEPPPFISGRFRTEPHEESSSLS